MSEQADIEAALARATAAYKNVRAERDALKDANDRAEAAEAERDRLQKALESIVQWSEAYPLNIFQEPDLNEAHRLLMAGGITLDAVSASMARHVVKGVGEIARAALEEEIQ